MFSHAKAEPVDPKFVPPDILVIPLATVVTSAGVVVSQISSISFKASHSSSINLFLRSIESCIPSLI